MAEHPTYRWTYLRAADVEPWAALTNLLARVDRTEEFYQPEHLREELEEDGVDPELDTWAVWSDAEDSALVAFGQVRVAHALDAEGRVRSGLIGGVHPEHRGRGLGRELIARQERRALDLAAQRHPGEPVYWRADGGVDGASVRGLLEHRGYTLARYFNELSRPVPGEVLAEPELDGVRLVTPTAELAEPLRGAHNQAFVDHWGSTAVSSAQWQEHYGSSATRLAVSTVVLDGQGRPLCYVLCGQWVQRELYVNLVGTVPAARGRGLARAALVRTIRLAAESGDYDVIELGVDSTSLTGATRLYDALGFTLVRVLASYMRDATD